ncbi:uracil DNA N-glycosylase Thp1 [Coemansia interrupta]|uniref:Uracil DNA N-glycosylase Thp1 n=1 Tax=Coemansia interrupta TaxID=1126814 RepID=A0A9W8LN77_9FUNG|nr:uracil DNA N-glycosylase Thp1 [Coemansia interrupta]
MCPPLKRPLRSDGKKTRRARPTEQDIAAFAPIPELLRPNLDVLIVGINPGVISGQKQLHFGNPNNFIWKGLFESGLIPEMIRPEDGGRLFSEWNMSIVNLVQRTTPSTSDLTLREMRDAVPELRRKISANRPKIICFVGMGIYRAFAGKSKVELGLQHEVYEYERIQDPGELPEFGHMFVMPSTSGRTSSYQNAEKLMYFRQLRYIRDCIAAAPEPAPIDHGILDALGPQVKSKYF